MATVINNPGTETVDSGGGWVFAVIVAIVLVALFLLFGLPAINNSRNNTTIPESIDVNIEGAGGTGGATGGATGGTQ